MNCRTCGKWLDSYERALNHYYLGRINLCYGDKDIDVDKECKDYVHAGQQFKYDYGGIQHWKKEDDGNIYPSTFGPEGYLYDVWFRRGFEAAQKLLTDPNFKKSCNNCYKSNPHLVGHCKNTELCDEWTVDYLRSFDKVFYGHLCDYCKLKGCSNVPTFKYGDLVWNCDSFEGQE